MRLGVESQQKTYEGLARYCLGSTGFYITSIFMFVFAFGAMCAYFIIIGDTSKIFFGESLAGRRGTISIVAIFIVLPLALLKDMSTLSSTSLVSIVADALIALIVVVAGPLMSKDLDPPPVPDYDFAKRSVFAGLGAMSFAYTCHHSSFLVYTSMRDQTFSSWTVVSRISIVIALVTSLTLALGGYLTFFQDTKGNVLNNFPNDHVPANVARALLGLTMILTYPMEMFVARHGLHAVLFDGKGPMTNARHYTISLSLWALSFVVAMTVTDLGFVLEFTGSLCASVLSYILPSMLYFKMNPFLHLVGTSIRAFKPSSAEYDASARVRVQRCGAWLPQFCMFLFGIVAMIAGTIQSFETLLGVDPPRIDTEP